MCHLTILLTLVCVCTDALHAGKFIFSTLNCLGILTKIFLHMPVRGMMYYRKALELQAFLDMAKDEGTYTF